MRVGILPLGRPTFDVAFAEEKLAAMLARLVAQGFDIVGPRNLLMDGAQADAALAGLRAQAPDRVLALQATFTDASFICRAAAALDAPLAIWAPREPRAGGRLRLNAFCGLNLAGHALGRMGRRFGWLLADPDETHVDALLADLLAGRRDAQALEGRPARAARASTCWRARACCGSARRPRASTPACTTPPTPAPGWASRSRRSGWTPCSTAPARRTPLRRRRCGRARSASFPGWRRWTRSSSTARCGSSWRWTRSRPRAAWTPSPCAAGRRRSPNTAARSAARRR